MKIFALGVIFEKHTYFRYPWNVFDFIIAILGIASFFPNDYNSKTIKFARIFKPLRALNATRGMRLLIGSLFDSFPELFNVIVFILFIMVLFGVIGI